MKKTFHELVITIILRELVDEFKNKGYKLFFNRNGNYNDVTETLFSGGLVPVLIWQMNRRLFKMKEGREPTLLADHFIHNVNVSLFQTNRTLCGAEIGVIDENAISVSKTEFIYLLRDAIYSLFNELPYIPNNKDKEFKDVTPAINAFMHWKAMHIQIQTVLLSSPELINKYSIDEKIPIQLTSEVLEFLNDRQKNPYFNTEYSSKPFSVLLKELLNENKAEPNLI